MIVNDGKLRWCGQRKGGGHCNTPILVTMPGGGTSPGSFERCADCGKEFSRCEDHGGIAAARRSLKSHRGLCHPRKGATS